MQPLAQVTASENLQEFHAANHRAAHTQLQRQAQERREAMKSINLNSNTRLTMSAYSGLAVLSILMGAGTLTLTLTYMNRLQAKEFAAAIDRVLENHSSEALPMLKPGINASIETYADWHGNEVWSLTGYGASRNLQMCFINVPRKELLNLRDNLNEFALHETNPETKIA